jgi:hypothetical protein
VTDLSRAVDHDYSLSGVRRLPRGLAFARPLAGADYFSKIKRERLVDGDGSHNNSTTNFEGEIT